MKRVSEERDLGEKKVESPLYRQTKLYISLCQVTLINCDSSVLVPARVNVNVFYPHRSE